LHYVFYDLKLTSCK